MFTKVNYLTLLFLLCFLISCFQPEQNCKNFHTGNFTFESEINGKIQTTRFVRNDSIEIDYYQGKTDTASIHWINDCEYVLTKLHPKNNQEKKPILIKIISTNDSSYIFEYSILNNPKKKQKGIAKVEK